MDQFTEILVHATASIPDDYFHLAIADADPIYRERVYCYELYHQMRLLWPGDSVYRLNGEVDKKAHPSFRRLGRYPQPDFLVHRPGVMDSNYAVMEVKPPRPREEAIEKDIDNLILFTTEVGYERGIYLVFGGMDQMTEDRIRERISDGEERIEVWQHDQAGRPARRTK